MLNETSVNGAFYHPQFDAAVDVKVPLPLISMWKQYIQILEPEDLEKKVALYIHVSNEQSVWKREGDTNMVTQTWMTHEEK